MPVTFTNEDICAQAIIDRVGKTLKVATPLAVGNAVLVLNGLYRKAKQCNPPIINQVWK